MACSDTHVGLSPLSSLTLRGRGERTGRFVAGDGFKKKKKSGHRKHRWEDEHIDEAQKGLEMSSVSEQERRQVAAPHGDQVSASGAKGKGTG